MTYYTELLSLSKDFVNVASMYGKIIISERFLPNAEKTIQPTNMGGIAGGYKAHSLGAIRFALTVTIHSTFGRAFSSSLSMTAKACTAPTRTP